MIDTLRVLEEIQRIDLEIKAVEEAEKEYLRNMEEIGSELKAAGEAISAFQAEVSGLNGQMKEVEEKIRESVEKVARDEGRINSVKNDRELNAITKEINGANRARKQSEQEKASLAARLSEKEGALNSRKEAFNSMEEESARLSGELDARRLGWRESLEAKLKSKDDVKVRVRPDILRKYEMIRSRRGGLGLVPVKDEICQGCFTHIPPQVYIMLKKGTEELQSCPHCHRLLYAEPHKEKVLEAV